MNIHEKEQFRVIITEGGKVISDRPIFDPIHSTTIKIPRGLRNAWIMLFRGIDLGVRIDATHEATKVIFNGDYSPCEDSKRETINTNDSCN